MVSELALMVICFSYNCLQFFMMGCCGWHFLQVPSSENQLFAKTFLALSHVCMMRWPLHSFSGVVEFLLICGYCQVGTSLYALEGMLLVINTEQLILLLKEQGN
jgi:hypothetical protein